MTHGTKNKVFQLHWKVVILVVEADLAFLSAVTSGHEVSLLEVSGEVPSVSSVAVADFA